VSAIRVPWSSASFLVYVGGLTMLAATGSLLGVQATRHGSGGLVFWALVVLIVLVALASGAASAGHAVTAGLLALSVVAGFVIFLGALLNWFGWLANLDTLPFRGFHVSLLFLELATAAAAFVAWRVFRFPLHVIVIAAATWFFVTDLVSNGGDWSAVVTILVGFALLAAARLVDDVSAFWLHVGAGLAIGGGVLWFLHGGAADWIGVALIGLVYIAFGDLARRSSWIVLGAWGILQAASFFAEKWSGATLALVPFFYLFPFTSGFDEYGESHAHPWLGPLVFVAAGLLFIGTGLALVRRRGDAIPAADLL
jgi:hypothetical protein